MEETVRRLECVRREAAENILISIHGGHWSRQECGGVELMPWKRMLVLRYTNRVRLDLPQPMGRNHQKEKKKKIVWMRAPYARSQNEMGRRADIHSGRHDGGTNEMAASLLDGGSTNPCSISPSTKTDARLYRLSAYFWKT